jgi:hypothetical protein
MTDEFALAQRDWRVCHTLNRRQILLGTAVCYLVDAREQNQIAAGGRASMS